MMVYKKNDMIYDPIASYLGQLKNEAGKIKEICLKTRSLQKSRYFVLRFRSYKQLQYRSLSLEFLRLPRISGGISSHVRSAYSRRSE